MSTKGKKVRASYTFHPLEIAFVGYSGSGKTTLITKILAALKSTWNLAYLKHDAHRFDMDKEGKDTFLAKKAGAVQIGISDSQHHAAIADGAIPFLTQKTLFLDADALLIEGYKQLALPKICVLNGEDQVWSELSTEGISEILAYVGEQPTPPSQLPSDAPYFSRDEVLAITNLILTHWEAAIQKRPLKALVLAGGKSQRMGRDKASLIYQGEEQALRVYHQLERLGVESYLSLRDETQGQNYDDSYRVVYDRMCEFGPISGILSAMEIHPESAWMVFACDLPLLTDDTILQLIEGRNAKRYATAYLSSSDGLPEPLAAIYEPKAKTKLYQALSLGIQCPRKVLLNTPCEFLTARDPKALDNANTPEDYLQIMAVLESRNVENHA